MSKVLLCHRRKTKAIRRTIMDWSWYALKSYLKFGNTSIATGYFANYNKYIRLGYISISICLKPPKFFTGLQLKQLAPSWELLEKYKNNNISADEYITQYRNQIKSSIKKKEILGKLTSYGDKVVLLCYEKPFDFCHRHVIGRMLSTKQYPIYEVNVGETK